MLSVDSSRKARIASRILRPIDSCCPGADTLATCWVMVEPPARALAAGHDLGGVIEHRADQARIIDPAVAEEGLVLGRDEGVDDQRRIFVIGELDPPLAGEGLDRIAVIAADVGRQRRLVGEQLLRRSAGRWRKTARPRRRTGTGRAPIHARRRTQRRSNHGIDPLVDPLVEGDQIGERQVGNGQALETSSRRASSRFGAARKASGLAARSRAATSASIVSASAATIARAVLGSSAAAARRRHC